MNIPQLDLTGQYNSIKSEINTAIKSVLESGKVINGGNVKLIENFISTYSGARYGIGVANGSDALYIALKALGVGEGDYVITTPFTFFATAGSITRVGATPIFVDIEPDTYNIDPVKIQEYMKANLEIGKNIKAIIPVHLFGQMCKMDEIMDIANIYNLKVIEDSAQSIGSEYKGKRAGSYGDIATLSFFPTKNLGTYGDGGMIVTRSKGYADYCKVFRSHGADPKYYHKLIGINSRLDEIHAAILLIKLRYLNVWLGDRFNIAYSYERMFERRNLLDVVRLPLNDIRFSQHREHTFNQYVIYARDRNKLQQYLKKKGIGTSIYYPLCLHLQECFKYLGYKVGDFPIAENASKHVLALPMYPELTGEQRGYVVGKISEFYR